MGQGSDSGEGSARLRKLRRVNLMEPVPLGQGLPLRVQEPLQAFLVRHGGLQVPRQAASLLVGLQGHFAGVHPQAPHHGEEHQQTSDHPQ